jgi:tetratricopeptide (TPR) repeat protein
VTRLKPRQGSFEKALDAYGSGDFSLCVEFLTESVSVESAALRARALVRLGDASTAVESLDALELSDVRHEIAAEILAVKFSALNVLNRPSDSSAVAVEARARCFSSGLVEIEGELLLGSALASLRDGEIDAAESAASAILNLDRKSPSWVTSQTYRYSLGFWRARACDVLGVIENLRGNYVGQASWTRRAFEEFDKSGVRDDFALVLLLANYADAAVSLGSKEIIDFIVHRSSSISWNSHLVAHEYRVFSLLAEAASSIGDQIGAIRYYRRCLDCAPSTALQIRAGVERATLLHAVGESFSAREEIDHVLRLSHNFNWESANVLEHRQLVFLAAQVAKFDGPQSLAMLSRYDALETNFNLGVTPKDDRFRGDESVARAAIFAANGSQDRAIMLLIDALETFTAAKLGSRAASAAAELALLTRESRYLEIVRAHCAEKPNSVLQHKLASLEQSELKIDEQPVVSRDLSANSLRSRPKLQLLS